MRFIAFRFVENHADQCFAAPGVGKCAVAAMSDTQAANLQDAGAINTEEPMRLFDVRGKVAIITGHTIVADGGMTVR
ncbi:MAG: hypothetical protein A3I66_16095 [Burkholderiales bacterium RIFCSPLOWO2_02_FULL_57_36]|nr:MAG: hypothetical protein A3I66_16095 [Burkholderiales bacterium RIFCSPLOWO2_02_FULL_57_36]